MDIRIATTIEDDKIKLLKVKKCDECPNGILEYHSTRTHSPGQAKGRRCELFDLDMQSYGGKIPEGCRLPSLLEIGQHLLEHGSCPLRGLLHE